MKIDTTGHAGVLESFQHLQAGRVFVDERRDDRRWNSAYGFSPKTTMATSGFRVNEPSG